MRLGWHPNALRDVDDILAYIQRRSPNGARNVSLSIERAAELCASVPYAGARTNLTDVYRSPLADRRIAIFYRVHAEQDLVEILRVVRSGRIRNLRTLPDA